MSPVRLSEVKDAFRAGSEKITARSLSMLALVCGSLVLNLVFQVEGFGQVVLEIFPDASAGEIQTNHNAQIGSPGVTGAGILITGSLIAASPLTTTRLRIAFPGPITAETAVTVANPLNCVNNDGIPIVCPNGTAGLPNGDPMRIEGATGLFASVAELRLNTSRSRIEVTLPGTGNSTNTNSGTFRIVGVRMDANGKSGAQSVTASLNNNANNYLVVTSTPTVINSLGPGIGSFAIGARPGQTDLGTATVSADGTITKATGSFILPEGFASAFRTALQSSNSGFPVAGGTKVRLTFNGLPAGMTLNLALNTEASLAATLSNSSITAAANTTTLSFTATSLSAIETPEIDYAVVVSGGAPFTAGTITATATLAPIGDGLDSSGLPREDQGYPTFAQSDLGPIPLVNITTGGPPVPTSVTAPAGTPQSTTVNTAFATALQVIVRDQFGAPFPNATVTFTAPSTGASLSAVSSSSTTNSNGIASLNAVANTVAGSYQVTASSGSAFPAIFSLTNTPGPPAVIMPTDTSQAIPTNETRTLQVTVKDAFGNAVPGVTVTFTVVQTGNAGATFPTGNTAVTNGSGQASLVVQANSEPGSYTVSAASGTATAASFSLTNVAEGVIVTVFPDTSAGEIQTNHNAQIARPGTAGAGILIAGFVVASSPLTTTTLRIAFPGPITAQPVVTVDNPLNCVNNVGNPIVCPNGPAGIPTGDPIRIEGASGLFAGLAEVRLNPSLSRIEVTLPGTGGDLNFLSGSFRIVGVRMDASGKSGAQSITASLNSSANNYFLGTTTATVINSLSPGIGSFAIGARPGQTSLGTATVRADGTVSKATGSFILSEGCASCWRTRTQSGGSNFEDLVANGSNIRLTFNNMPAGMTLNLMANTEASLSATLSNSTITTAANTTTISFTATNLSAVETPEIDYTVVVSGGAPFTPGAITATATLAPIGAGLDSSGLPREDQGYPTFAEADLGPITLVNIVPGPKKVPPQITSQ